MTTVVVICLLRATGFYFLLLCFFLFGDPIGLGRAVYEPLKEEVYFRSYSSDIYLHFFFLPFFLSPFPFFLLFNLFYDTSFALHIILLTLSHCVPPYHHHNSKRHTFYLSTTAYRRPWLPLPLLHMTYNLTQPRPRPRPNYKTPLRVEPFLRFSLYFSWRLLIVYNLFSFFLALLVNSPKSGSSCWLMLIYVFTFYIHIHIYLSIRRFVVGRHFPN
ncbi:hypothetical protein BDZ97DRAFT_770878 [Flammula alnicola]|nr:hypothetical protein BDZ97DRAFT_770878 [Flammula alnicola]